MVTVMMLMMIMMMLQVWAAPALAACGCHKDGIDALSALLQLVLQALHQDNCASAAAASAKALMQAALALGWGPLNHLTPFLLQVGVCALGDQHVIVAACPTPPN